MKTVDLYNAMIDRLSADPSASLDDLYSVARGEAAAKWLRLIRNDRVRGLRQVGTTRSTFLSSAAEQAGTIQHIRECMDVSHVEVVDRSGRSVVPKSRTPRLQMTFTVSLDPVAQEWFVMREQANGSTC